MSFFVSNNVLANIRRVPFTPYAVFGGLQVLRSRSFSTIFNVTGETFTERVLKADKPVIVDFQAGWCGPCRRLGPMLIKLVSQHHGSVLLAKVDVDQESQLAIQHDVQHIPTVIAYYQGKIENRFHGVREYPFVSEFVFKAKMLPFKKGKAEKKTEKAGKVLKDEEK